MQVTSCKCSATDGNLNFVELWFPKRIHYTLANTEIQLNIAFLTNTGNGLSMTLNEKFLPE